MSVAGCPAGTFGNVSGQYSSSSCLGIAPLRCNSSLHVFVALSGCSVCPAGTYSAAVGSTSCTGGAARSASLCIYTASRSVSIRLLLPRRNHVHQHDRCDWLHACLPADATRVVCLCSVFQHVLDVFLVDGRVSGLCGRLLVHIGQLDVQL